MKRLLLGCVFVLPLVTAASAQPSYDEPRRGPSYDRRDTDRRDYDHRDYGRRDEDRRGAGRRDDDRRDEGRGGWRDGDRRDERRGGRRYGEPDERRDERRYGGPDWDRRRPVRLVCRIAPRFENARQRNTCRLREFARPGDPCSCSSPYGPVPGRAVPTPRGYGEEM
jgi:hypothetical protein